MVKALAKPPVSKATRTDAVAVENFTIDRSLKYSQT